MLKQAIDDLRAGRPILVFDSREREGETDIVVASQFINNEKIKFMRKAGGGLICTTMKEADAKLLGLPYLEDFYRQHLDLGERAVDHSDLKYDKDSSFSVTINYRDTFTGISDKDRSSTILKFSDLVSNLTNYNRQARNVFVEQFRIPGHVILLIAREDYFLSRRGHTELSTYLVEKANLIPSATIVEMLGDDGNSLPFNKASDFARQNSLTFIEGEEIIEQFKINLDNGG
ncbi:MAG: 3,4-dihydroxy-2-butanone-4-phosphate synthase [Candidatus Thermoplasmatota archaeon]|nr:3,4-dihydroxy-2-butanone-4-phosphate synthase [Candidatus Thermoplasmatota archaeon]MCL5954848.1 3,4-dihydroxy-2-butanone-4-phosphate synthase [Candidatus Thermoplasmatota archaeon]